MRNWYYFTWLCGDHIVEQHVHNLDAMNWVIGSHPESAYGMGGRQVRTDPAFGQIFDHFAVEYVYPGGVRVMSMCRQTEGTDGRVSEYIMGSKGRSNLVGEITGQNPWKFEGRGAESFGAGAHRPDQQHSVGQSAERRPAGRREHADGDHGTDVGVHGQDDQVGAGDELEAEPDA